MFMQLYLNDSFMIRKIVVAAVPAALVAVGMSLAISEPANACRRGCYVLPGVQLNLGGGGGGAPNTTNTNTNTNQVYPNNQSSGGGAFAGAQSTNGSFTMMGSYGY